MKILFLQLWYDLYGGLEAVNDTLAKQFTMDGYETTILCLWKKGKGEYIPAKTYQKKWIGDEPIRASYKQLIRDLLHLHFKVVYNGIKKSLKCYRLKRQHKKVFKEEIIKNNPDFIIVSNPDLIELVPKHMLSKTVIHMHSGLKFYYDNIKTTKLIQKYNDKVNKIIFLSPKSMEAAKQLGLTNSTYMYNPVKIKTLDKSSLRQKNIVFLGRIAPEKRIDILINIFEQSGLANNDWHLKIYGTGNIENNLKTKNVEFMGGTDDVASALKTGSIFCLTSEYEGFPMVILEAYECGVPVIVFDYGVSASELVVNGKTGYIIPMNDIEAYISHLQYLCENAEVRFSMAEKAKSFVQQYYPEVVVKRWYKLFRGEL